MSRNTQLPPFRKYVRALPTGERNSALIIIVRIKPITARLMVNSFLLLRGFKLCLWAHGSVEQNFNFILSGSVITAATTKHAVAYVPLSPGTRIRVTKEIDKCFPQ